MFLSEKTVPNTNFASSSALSNRGCRSLLLNMLPSAILAPLPPLEDGGRDSEVEGRGGGGRVPGG